MPLPALVTLSCRQGLQESMIRVHPCPDLSLAQGSHDGRTTPDPRGQPLTLSLFSLTTETSGSHWAHWAQPLTVSSILRPGAYRCKGQLCPLTWGSKECKNPATALAAMESPQHTHSSPVNLVRKTVRGCRSHWRPQTPGVQALSLAQNSSSYHCLCSACALTQQSPHIVWEYCNYVLCFFYLFLKVNF